MQQIEVQLNIGTLNVSAQIDLIPPPTDGIGIWAIEVDFIIQ